MSKDWKVPLDEHGGLPQYGTDWYGNPRPDFKWVDRDYQFVGTLRFVRIERGASAVRWVFCDTENEKRTFSFSILRFEQMLREADFTAGCVAGRFSVAHQSGYYGLRYIGPLTPQQEP
jgi:hypothetical protein